MRSDRPCLWCSEPLAIPPPNDITADREPAREPSSIITCTCGITYSAELLAQDDDAEWNAVLRRDGYTVEREGDTLWITDERARDRWADAQ